MGVIKNLAIFLSLLSEPCRVSYLPVLHDILHSTNPFNWRLRQLLALQLPELINLPPKRDVYMILFPLVMTLLQDPVAMVRKESYKGAAKMINVLYELTLQQQTQTVHIENNHNQEDTKDELQHVYDSKHDLDVVIKTINSLIRGETYQVRQLWLELAHRLLRDLPQEVFETYFIEGILILTSDRVSNVRVTVAMLLGGWEPEHIAPWEEEEPSNNNNNTISTYNPWKWLLQRDDIKQCVERMSQDDSDVYHYMIKLQPLFPDITFVQKSCRGFKVAPGGEKPVLFIGHVDGNNNNILSDEIETETVVIKADSIIDENESEFIERSSFTDRSSFSLPSSPILINHATVHPPTTPVPYINSNPNEKISEDEKHMLDIMDAMDMGINTAPISHNNISKEEMPEDEKQMMDMMDTMDMGIRSHSNYSPKYSQESIDSNESNEINESNESTESNETNKSDEIDQSHEINESNE